MDIAWAFTGAGHFLKESAELLGQFGSRFGIDVYLSRAAAEVLKMYDFTAHIRECARSVSVESGYSFPATSKFSVGRYSALLMAPATGNTVAKCVSGIADSLVSCMFAQAGKCRVPIYVLPTDISAEMESVAPNGNRVMIYPRPVDLELTRRIAAMEGVVVFSSPEALRSWFEKMSGKL
ncbi:MAG: flavoprotein [Synergistaceae bacterium]|nr:flavoprotein [Synergistaceae bacterium]